MAFQYQLNLAAMKLVSTFTAFESVAMNSFVSLYSKSKIMQHREVGSSWVYL